MTFTTACQEASSWAVDANWYNLADGCLRTYCGGADSSAIQSFLDASTTVWTTSTRIMFQGFPGSGSLSDVVVSQTTWTETYTFTLDPPQAVTPKPPCCGQCTLRAATVQLFFWPETAEAATPIVTGLLPNATAAASGLLVDGPGIYVDESGFTFTSPSIYIGFTSLGGHNRCGPVGTPVFNTTMAFDPTEISSVLPHETTAECIVTPTYDNGVVGEVTYRETAFPPPQPLTMSDVVQNCKQTFNMGPGAPPQVDILEGVAKIASLILLAPVLTFESFFRLDIGRLLLLHE